MRGANVTISVLSMFSSAADGKLGILAEHLLLFDTVGLRIITGSDAGQIFGAIPLAVLEELVATGALAIVWDPERPFVMSKRAFDGSFRPTLGPQSVIKAYEEIDNLIVSVMSVRPNFEERFDDATRAFLPGSLRQTLLSTARTIRVNPAAFLETCKADLHNPTVLSAAETGFSGTARLAVKILDIFMDARLGTGAVADTDLPTAVKLQRIFKANYMLAVAALGYCVTGFPGDQEIIEAKLRGVFQNDPSKVPGESFRALLDIHGLPSVESMVDAHTLSLDEIVRLRRKEGGAFRRWFYSLIQGRDATAQDVITEYTNMLLVCARKPTLARRVAVYAAEQLSSLLNPFLGAGIQAVVDFVAPLRDDGKPYLLFDYLRTKAKPPNG